MTERCRVLLNQLLQSGSSESAAVGDCLLTIAENGGEQSNDNYLVGCAGEIRDAAQGFIDAMQTSPT